MGGKEASRGFIYQGFTAVIEALTQEGWDEIYVEFPTDGDKVDIALKNEGQIIKSIQVKSTINTFSKSSVATWIKDLVADVSSLEYQVCLIGQCEKDTIILLNSICKYQNGIVDGVSTDSLKAFDKTILSEAKIEANILPFDVEILLGIVRDTMHKYISMKGYKISYEQVEVISNAILSTQMLLSTNGSSITKEAFDEKIFKWIELMGGSALQKATPSAKHKLQFYNLDTKTFSDTAAPLHLTEYAPYKGYLSEILVKCREYIEIISKIDLPAYSGDVSQDVKMDIEKGLVNQDLLAALMAPHKAEMKDKEKEEIISKAKLLLNIDINPGLFYVGNLTSTHDILKRTFELNGEDIEKKKHYLLWELSSEFIKYDLAQLFSGTFSEYILIPVEITNISAVTDDDITVQIRIDNSSATILNPNQYARTNCSQALADCICSNKLIDIFFALPTDSTISKENEMFFEPVRRSMWGDYKYTSEDFQTSLERHFATATSTQDNQSIYEFQIKSLRPNETKWLNRIIVVKPLRSEFNIAYQMLSNKSDGTLSGIIKILNRDI